MLLAVDGQAAALFAIRDPLREDSVDALARLHRQGYRLVMLTGDNPTTAKAIAKEAGIDEVIAGVLPDGKADAIKRLQSQGHKVAMVGDGINDAPALAQADVGIAMGGGSDVAIETAAITLMRHSLHGVADALAISKATLRNMKQNLLGAFVYNSLGIPIAAGILWPPTGTLLNPVVAGAAMALSSITVVSNANRLLRFKPKSKRRQMKRALTLFGARFLLTQEKPAGRVTCITICASMKSSHFGARMGLLNRIKMLWRAAVGSSYSLACDGYRPARRTLFAPRRQHPYGHPRHGAAASEASEKNTPGRCVNRRGRYQRQ